jgi:hypothetical protein
MLFGFDWFAVRRRLAFATPNGRPALLNVSGADLLDGFYLHNGQQPVAATLVAAAAAVLNSATSATAYPTSFIFIDVLPSIL